jgi:hypothetical protein
VTVIWGLDGALMVFTVNKQQHSSSQTLHDNTRQRGYTVSNHHQPSSTIIVRRQHHQTSSTIITHHHTSPAIINHPPSSLICVLEIIQPFANRHTRINETHRNFNNNQ